MQNATPTYVYILASKPYGVLYVGVTTKPSTRFEQHDHGGSRFATRFNVRTLVYIERHDDLEAARHRERRLKRWRRDWKVALIEGLNPDWVDLRARLNEWF